MTAGVCSTKCSCTWAVVRPDTYPFQPRIPLRLQASPLIIHLRIPPFQTENKGKIRCLTSRTSSSTSSSSTSSSNTNSLCRCKLNSPRSSHQLRSSLTQILPIGVFHTLRIHPQNLRPVHNPSSVFTLRLYSRKNQRSQQQRPPLQDSQVEVSPT